MIRTYVYAARRPIVGVELVAEQLRLAVEYQRDLVAIERKRRAVIDRLYRHAGPREHGTCDELEVALTAARDRVTEARAAQESAGPIEAEIAAIRQALRDAWAVRRVARKAATHRIKTRLRWCDRGAFQRRKVAYNAAGALAWGTRLSIGESVERAAKAAAKEGSLPRFPRHDGGGRVVVQLQGDLRVPAALACTDTRLRIERVTATEFRARQGIGARGRNGMPLPVADPTSARQRRRAERGVSEAIVSLRVGSHGRAPVWASWPVILHRPLPERGRIRWATMHAQTIGPRIEWRLLLTVEEEDATEREGGAIAAVNLGWRNLRDGGIRAAYVVGGDGHEQEVRVPPEYTRRVAHADSLVSILDRNRSVLIARIVAYARTGSAPEGLRRAVTHAHMWRSRESVKALRARWGTTPDGDDQLVRAIDAWAKQDDHLWRWSADERVKAAVIRREHYRRTAAQLAERYARIVVTEMDLRDFAEAAPVEEATASEGRNTRRTQRHAAPSVLRGAIVNACFTRGVRFEERHALTVACSSCGSIEVWDRAANLTHACAACGTVFDQDSNHCRNLLASATVPIQGSVPLALVRNDAEAVAPAPAKREGRWHKRRLQALAKAAETAGAVQTSFNACPEVHVR